MNKYDKHMEICNKFNQIYRDKNSDYGDSFSRTWKNLNNNGIDGLLSSYTRIADKFYRFESFVLNPQKEIKIKDESIKDTLLDMANYCIMSSMEMDFVEDIETESKFSE